MQQRLMRIEKIVWVDATGHSGWGSKEEYQHSSVCPKCISIGFVFEETKEHITLIQTQDPQSESLDNSITIPTSMIVKRRVMR